MNNHTMIVKLNNYYLLKEGESAVYICKHKGFTMDCTSAFAVNPNNEVISYSNKVYVAKAHNVLEVYTLKQLGLTERQYNNRFKEEDIVILIEFNKLMKPYPLEKKVRGKRKHDPDEKPLLEWLLIEDYCNGEAINPLNVPDDVVEFAMEEELLDGLYVYQFVNKRENIQQNIKKQLDWRMNQNGRNRNKHY